VNSILNKAAGVVTEVLKGAATGALVGAIDTGAKVAGVGQQDKSKSGGSASTSKTSSSGSKTANKKTKSGK